MRFRYIFFLLSIGYILGFVLISFLDANDKEKLNFHKKKKHVPKLNLKTEERPPFLSYGWADKQVETGRKKSHNVYAPKKSVSIISFICSFIFLLTF